MYYSIKLYGCHYFETVETILKKKTLNLHIVSYNRHTNDLNLS